IEVLETSIPASIQKANIEKEDIIGIGLDFTSCTILPVKEDFSPLCLDEKWESEPNAWLSCGNITLLKNRRQRLTNWLRYVGNHGYQDTVELFHLNGCYQK